MEDFNFTISGWETVDQRKVYDTPIFSLHKRHSTLAEEELEGDFYILRAPTWVNVIATTENEEVVTVEQYRHGIERPTLEIPGGVVDEGETPRQAVERELLEETGYESEKWHDLGTVSSNPAILTNYTRLYWAENCVRSADPSTDDHEIIQTHLLPVRRFLSLVRDGNIHHALVVAATAKFLLHRTEINRFD